MDRKVKLSIEEQIKYMQNKGIKFDLFSIEQAKFFLEQSNYYFKVKSFAKNYLKDESGKYIDLEFEYLRKFSILDTIFRDLILNLSLTSEHLLKTALCSYCSSNANDDGYEVVEKYLENNRNIPQELKRYDDGKKSIYSQDLLDKYRYDFAVWNFVEILSFGELIAFYKFYTNFFSITDRVNVINLYATKSIRNVAAHNSCILNTITSRPINFTRSIELQEILKSEGILSTRGKSFKIPMIHDFICLVYVFNKLCPPTEMKNILVKKINIFFENFEEKDEYYTNPLIKQRYEFVKRATNFILS